MCFVYMSRKSVVFVLVVAAARARVFAVFYLVLKFIELFHVCLHCDFVCVCVRAHFQHVCVYTAGWLLLHTAARHVALSSVTVARRAYVSTTLCYMLV